MKNLKHKGFLSTCVITAAALVIASGTVYAAQTEYIGGGEAKIIALEHAGVTEQDASFINAYLHRDDGKTVYDVEFYSGDIEYDYEIDAVSGEIREFDRDIERFSIPADDSRYIGMEEAKALAIEHAAITGEYEFTSERLDRDDRRVVYELRFTADGDVYTYEMDAMSGEIWDYSYRADYTAWPDKTSDSGQYISEAEAASIALASAGLDKSDVRRLRTKLSREEGVRVYEVEFRSGWEYEYDINPVNGAILKIDVEYDD